MSIKNQVLTYLKENKEYLKNKYGVKEIYLFGSVARGEDTANSDIDLLVEFDENKIITWKQYLGLGYELEKKFNKKIDIATKEMIKPVIKKFVYKDLISV